VPDRTTTAATQSGTAAFSEAGLRPSDIDLAELHDAFTINTLLCLENLGFVEKGEAGAFVGAGGISPGGRLPVNTNGGGLSYCHPCMYGVFLITEAVRQLRGEAGAAQVNKDAHRALIHGNGGVLSAQATVILGEGCAV
jgi:acetyl-CoA acetyltransferase